MELQEFTEEALRHDDIAGLKGRYEARGLDFDAEVKEVVHRKWFLSLLKDAGGMLFQVVINVLKSMLTKKLERL